MAAGMNAGSVFVRLGADVDRRGFETYEREVVKAQKIQDIQTRLQGDFEPKEFERYEKALKETQARVAKRDAFKATLGADYNPKAFAAYERDLKRAERANSDMVKSNGRLRTAFGSVWGVGGAAFAAAGGAYAVVAAVKAITTAYAESEVSQTKMKTQLAALGIDYDKHAAKIDKVIQKTSQLAGLDDEDLQDAFTAIVRTTGDVNKSLELTALAADIARAKHMDVAKAGELVAKVAGGNTGILKRYGVSIKDGATASEALALAQDKFRGQAEGYGKTQQGAMDRVNVAFENLQETLGTALAPTLTKAANAVANFINELQSGEGTGGKVMKVLKDTGQVLKDLWPTFKFLGRIVQETFKGIWEQIQGVARVIRGVSDIVSGIAHGDWSKAWNGLKDVVGGVMQSIKGAILRATAPIRVGLSALWDGVGDSVTTAFRTVERVVGGALDKVLGGLTSVLGVAGDVLNVLGKVPGMGWAKDAARDLKDLRGELDDARASMRKWGDETDSGSKSTKRLEDRVAKYAGRVVTAKERLKTLTKGTGEYRDAAQDLDKKQQRLNAAIRDASAAGTKGAKGIGKLGDAADSASGAVGDAAQDIAANVNNLASSLGAKGIKFTVAKGKKGKRTQSGVFGPLPDFGSDPIGKAGGGWIGMPGEMGPDDVPIVVGRGEAVLNRHQQGVIESMLGDGFLDSLFSNVTTPHYMAAGGIVGRANTLDKMALPYVWGGHHGDQGPIADPRPGLDCSSAVSYVLGIPPRVSGQFESYGKPGKGPVTLYANSDHVFMSILGRGFGTSGENPGGGPGWISYNSRPGFVVRHVDGDGDSGLSLDVPVPVINGPAGALKNILGAAAKRMASAGSTFVTRQLGSLDSASGQPLNEPVAKGSYSLEALRRLWVRAGGPASVATLMAHIAQAESGGNPKAHNPSGATGLWQILGSVLPGNLYDPLVNARNAVAKWRAGGTAPWNASRSVWSRYAARGGWARAAKGKKGKPAKATLGGKLPGGVGRGGQAGAARTSVKIGSASDFTYKPYEDTISQIDTLEHQYTLKERVYNRDDSPLIDEETGLINEEGLGQRVQEIEGLIKVRHQIEKLWEQAQEMAQRAIDTIRTLISRLQNALKFAKRKDRSGIRSQIKDFQDLLPDWQDNADTAYWNAQDSAQDIIDLTGERNALEPDTRKQAEDIIRSLSSGLDDEELDDTLDESFGDTQFAPPTPEQIAAGVYEQLQSFNASRASMFASFGSNFVPRGVAPGADATSNAAGPRYYGAVEGNEAPVGLAGGPTIINNFAAPPPDPHTWTQTQRFMLETI